MEKEQREVTQPSQEELVNLLSQTVLQQEETIKKLKEELASPRTVEPVIDETPIIDWYLQKELKYAEAKVVELRHHLADYPEDGYSHTDLQNCLLHINYLKAAIRRLHL